MINDNSWIFKKPSDICPVVKMTLNDIINKLRCLNETIKCLVLLVSEHQPVLIWMSVGTFFVES